MYESPIELIEKDLRTQVENDVYKAVLDVGVVVDKDELVRALQYDRGQYEKGYADGYADAQAEIIKYINELKTRVYELHENWKILKEAIDGN